MRSSCGKCGSSQQGSARADDLAACPWGHPGDTVSWHQLPKRRHPSLCAEIPLQEVHYRENTQQKRHPSDIKTLLTMRPQMPDPRKRLCKPRVQLTRRRTITRRLNSDFKTLGFNGGPGGAKSCGFNYEKILPSILA